MSLFLSDKELLLWKDINNELINNIINQSVVIYTINSNLTQMDDVYSESSNKVYNAGITVNCLIEFGEITSESTLLGNMGSTQELTLYILRSSLVDNNVFFEIGDIVYWDSKYFELTFIDSQKRVDGLQQHRWDVQAKAKLTDLNSISLG